MKNRSILLVLLMVLALLLAGCGKKTDTPDVDTPTDATGGTQGAAVESLIDWMKGGVFSYDFVLTSEYEGQVTEATGSMAMENGKYAVTMETVVDGATVHSRIIILDDKLYVIDDASRMVIEMSGAGPEMTAGLPTDFTDITYVSGGTGEVDGRTLPYEEYSSEGYSVKFYMDGNAVYAVETEGEGAYALMIISNASNKAPAGAFDIPDDYTLMSF